MGVGSGYSQQDVQELARILTGLGVNLNGPPPGIHSADFRLEFRDDPRNQNLTLFNAKRHDFGEKQFLGTTIKHWRRRDRHRGRHSGGRAAHRTIRLASVGAVFLL